MKMKNKYNEELLVKLIKKLVWLSQPENEPKYERIGTCSNLVEFIVLEDLVDLYKPHLHTFDFYSGDNVYPIKSPDPSYDSAEYYYNTHIYCKDEMWSVEYEYGRYRRVFCLWLANIISDNYL
jgi:hypothetical protein